MCHSCNPGTAMLGRAGLAQIANTQSNLPPPQEPPVTPTDKDVIFTGGPIITMAGGKLSPVTALAISGSKIIATGSLSAVQSRAAKSAVIHDLAGRCLLPGFVEPHLHLALTALAKYWLTDVSPLTCSTMQLALQALEKTVGSTPPGQWAAAYGYDPSRVLGHLDLDAEILDGVSTEVPIFVLNQSGHVGYTNHIGLQKAGITDSTPDPPGGHYGRDQSGHLTGIVYEASAVQPFAAKVTYPSLTEWEDMCRKVLSQWSSKGCTTVFDAGIGTVANTLDATIVGNATASAPDKPCPVRFLGAMTSTCASDLNANHPPYQTGGATFNSIKFWADGSTQGFSGAVREQFLGGQGFGSLDQSDWTLREGMAKWQKQGWQLVVHSNGDRATDQTIAAYTSVLNSLPEQSTILHRIEHFTVTKPEQLDEVQRLGLAVSHTIGHVYYWGQAFRDFVLGDPRARRIDPVKDDISHGLVYSFHSDSPVTDVDPLLYVRTAVTRMMYNSEEVLGPEQCVSLEEALAGVTLNPAKQVLLGDEIGSLEVGKSADMVILDVDPRNVDHKDLGDLIVMSTWLRGSKVYDRVL